jgi:hypothetical protein
MHCMPCVFFRVTSNAILAHVMPLEMSTTTGQQTDRIFTPPPTPTPAVMVASTLLVAGTAGLMCLLAAIILASPEGST